MFGLEIEIKKIMDCSVATVSSKVRLVSFDVTFNG